MHRVSLHPPEIRPHEARFAWDVEPATPLYRSNAFTLRFPEDVNLASVPPALWWTAAIVCLHAHWALLRPCVVRLPVTLPPGARETWTRLLAAEGTTIDAYRQGPESLGAVEIVEDGPPVGPGPALPDLGRCAAAYSGGKDSLLHAGALAELTARPVLVTTTSPLPPQADHTHPRRLRAIVEARLRLDADVVEVHSDFRSIWDNRFPRTIGCPMSVNEVTDTFLYAAVTMLVAAAKGATHVFLASENEVSETAELDGRTVQHPHFMYSFPTQRALDGLVAGTGLRYGSLTYALHSNQVQELLWTRYPTLRDLQFSCWKAPHDRGACSRCSQCLRISMCALALDDDPSLLGVDLARVFVAMRAYDPFAAPDDPREAALPEHLTARRLRAHVARYVARVPTERVQRRLAQRSSGWRAALGVRRATRCYDRMRERFARHDVGEAPGYRAGYLRACDPLLAVRWEAIVRAHFTPEPEAGYAATLARCERLASWIREPLGLP